MKSFRHFLLFALAATMMSAPAPVFACAACYGQSSDAMAGAMNWAIITLGVIVATVLGAFLTFFIYVIRKGAALEAAAQKNSPELTKV